MVVQVLVKVLGYRVGSSVGLYVGGELVVDLGLSVSCCCGRCRCCWQRGSDQATKQCVVNGDDTLLIDCCQPSNPCIRIGKCHDIHF